MTNSSKFSFLLLIAIAPVQVAADESKSVVSQLASFLKSADDAYERVAEQPFAAVALTRQQSQQARDLLLQARASHLIVSRAAEMNAKVIVDGELRMPFDFIKFGKKPKNGRSLYLSLHGGGGAPKQVNDRQWENQKRLYRLDEGIYVAPRAPTDAWNLWHQGHIDRMFARLIENMVLFESVDWNRVYVMGYSAGGDGVYQLAPRMADRWAAAAMMAGHPNETSPLGLRNVPFALQVGGRDAAYNRNKIAGQWSQRLAELKADDSGGYEHFAKIYKNKGHWMDREDAAAIPWMAKFQRDPTPTKIVWVQDDVTHRQYYWLAVDSPKARSKIIAKRDNQTIELIHCDVPELTIHVDDRFIDLQRPITVRNDDTILFEGSVKRTIGCLAQTLALRGDPNLCFAGRVDVKVDDSSP